MISTTFLLDASALAAAGYPEAAPDCREGLPSESEPVCRVPGTFTPADVLTSLEGEQEAARLRDGVLLLAARSEDDEVRLCCSVQEPLTPRGHDLFADRFQLHRGDEAVIAALLPSTKDYVVLRGPAARTPPLPDDEADEDDVEGEITEGVLRSDALGERRRYVLYTPPGFEPGRPYPMLILADGDSLSGIAAQLEAMTDEGVIVPVVAVGVPSGTDAIVADDGQAAEAYGYDVRTADYLRGWIEEGEPGADRFERHLRFVADELVPHAVAELGVAPGRVVVAGWSNGGAFAASAGVLRPDVFDAAIPLSEAGAGVSKSELPTAPAEAPDFFFASGLYEGPFRRTSRDSAAALTEAGYRTRYCAYSGGHDYPLWTLALTDALAVVFEGQDRPSVIPPCPDANGG